MLNKTNYSINPELLQNIIAYIDTESDRSAINQPTGNFFYDPWEIKPEFRDTIWETIYDSLPKAKGEARIIRLTSGEGYVAHADIDDRFHLNLIGNNAFLIDLEKEQMIKLQKDGCWYEMDAGIIHTAANFGNETRYQLVVRKLLTRNILENIVKVELTPEIADLDTVRYFFDNNISGWINNGIKQGYVNNFDGNNARVSFELEQTYTTILENICKNIAKITYQ